MQLREFVKETLQEIIVAVEDAQKFAKEHGAGVNPGLRVAGSVQNIHFIEDTSYTGANFAQMIEFDIAITAETNDSQKGGIGIFIAPIGVGVQGENQATNSEVSRVKFSIPIVFPKQTV